MHESVLTLSPSDIGAQVTSGARRNLDFSSARPDPSARGANGSASQMVGETTRHNGLPLGQSESQVRICGVAPSQFEVSY